MTFADSVRFLFTLGHELKTVKWDLERIAALLDALGSPQHGRFTHVAGTNGKGSTSAMIAAGLRHAGYRTGLFTSPHLVSPTERIQIDGTPVSEDLWTAAFEQVHAAAERLLASGSIDAHPSFFETLTAMAFVIFAAQKLDRVVLEVGLGGRLDATNVIVPELAVITPIDFDHEAFLGSSIQAIAGEKAGILKPGVPAVISSQRPEALAIIQSRAKALGSRLTLAAEVPIFDLALDRYGSSFRLGNNSGLPIQCPLAGEHQVDNARTAAISLRHLGISDETIAKGIGATSWPGRLQRVATNPDIILDGAHNPAGARALASYCRRFFPNEPIRLIFGAMRDKAFDEVTNTLFPLAAEVVLTQPKQPRALHPDAVREVIDHPNLLVCEDLTAALARVAQKPMTTFITGSLYLVGEATEILCPR